jgi:hypothetical protein
MNKGSLLTMAEANRDQLTRSRMAELLHTIDIINSVEKSINSVAKQAGKVRQRFKSNKQHKSSDRSGRGHTFTTNSFNRKPNRTDGERNKHE